MAGIDGTSQIDISSTPVNLSEGLTSGETYYCMNGGDSIVYSVSTTSTSAPDIGAVKPKKYVPGQEFALQVKSALKDWCFCKYNEISFVTID